MQQRARLDSVYFSLLSQLALGMHARARRGVPLSAVFPQRAATCLVSSVLPFSRRVLQGKTYWVLRCVSMPLHPNPRTPLPWRLSRKAPSVTLSSTRSRGTSTPEAETRAPRLMVRGMELVQVPGAQQGMPPSRPKGAQETTTVTTTSARSAGGSTRRGCSEGPRHGPG